nr:hypothetical protein [Tanacetum cinerariifolium]
HPSDTLVFTTKMEILLEPTSNKLMVDDLLSIIKELGYSGNYEMISTIHTDQMHQPWSFPKKARKFKKSASPKLNIVHVSPKEPTQKGKRVKRHFIKATTAPTTNVVISDTPDQFVSKRKAPAKADRGKGIKLFSDVALLEDAQLKKTLRKSKRETHKLQASGSSEGADFELEIPNDQTGKTKDTSEGTDESDDVHDEDDNNDDDGNDNDDGNDDSGNDDDGGNDAQDSERTDLDDDENPSFTLKDYDEKEQDEEYVHIPEKDKSDNEDKMYEEEDDVAKDLYGYLNIIQGLRDTDMTNAKQGGEDKQNASHESGFKLEEDDGHVTLTSVHDKTEGTMKSSSVSSNFTSKLLNLDNTGPDVNEIASLMNTSKVPPPPLPTSYAVVASLSEFKLKKILIDKMETNEMINRSYIQRNLYNALVESYNTNKDILSSYGDVVTLKRGRDDQDKDEDPSVRSDRGTQKRKSSKDVEPSKGSKSSSSSKGTQSQPKSSDDQPDNEAAPKHDWFQKPNKPPTPDYAWHKSKSINFRPPQKWISTIAKERQTPHTFDELIGTAIDFSAYVMNQGREYSFDLSKPLPLIEDRGRQVVSDDYFINNDLEYLKGGSSSSKYATSTTRTKTAKYDNIKGIEDMVPTLWSPVKVAYNKHVIWGTYHWGPKRQRFYAYACHWKSPHDVYSKKEISVVTIVKVMKWYNYGYLEEIVVRRDDNMLYKFKEGDFPRLNLCDIEDMLLLLVQKKLSNLDIDDQYDLEVALRMFTRRIVILYRVEDLQMGVESYQKKLNVTRPEKLRSDIPNMIPYTVTVLCNIASSLEMDYLPKRH